MGKNFLEQRTVLTSVGQNLLNSVAWLIKNFDILNGISAFNYKV